ncbi:MAG: DNA alkylation repair protein [Armatimonadetes bacterium]|nr:DNA alkylation repair protein [Armatimonadota bacterium]
MTCQEILSRLESLGSERQREINAKNGAPANQFGAKMGDVRTVAKEAKVGHDLAMELWSTGNLEARLVAVLSMKPKQLSEKELEDIVGEITYSWLADWMISYVVKQYPGKESLRAKWMDSNNATVARAGWSLTTERVVKNRDGLDMVGLLERIEREMPGAPGLAQWTMNHCLAEIGIECPELRDRAVGIGEKLGLYRDYPTSKGCTSPFAPIWIREMSARKAD